MKKTKIVKTKTMQYETVEQFLRRGGVVTVCKTRKAKVPTIRVKSATAFRVNKDYNLGFKTMNWNRFESK